MNCPSCNELMTRTTESQSTAGGSTHYKCFKCGTTLEDIYLKDPTSSGDLTFVRTPLSDYRTTGG